MCNNRVVLFDNKTNDQAKKESQLGKLLSLVDKVMEKNGQRFSHELFEEIREAAKKKMQQEKEVKASEGCNEHELAELLIRLQISYFEQIKKMEEKVESTLEEIQKQLDEEKAARSKATKDAQDAKAKADEEIRRLNEELGKKGKGCAIL